MTSREVLLLAGAAALLPLFAGQGLAQSTPLSARPFVPPELPQVLTRTVWRTLADGEQIVVRRRYAVQFTRNGDEFFLDGRLLDATVDAPPMLAALAELERKRGDEGLFPMRLDAAGRIRVGTNAAATTTVLREAAREQSQGLLAASPLAVAQRQESDAFLKQLVVQGAPVAWPADLFNPAKAEQNDHRRIALPDGQEGEVRISIKVVGSQPRSLPQSVERIVTTVLAGTARTSREQWTLAPHDGSIR
jgi:hypothetical protein